MSEELNTTVLLEMMNGLPQEFVSLGQDLKERRDKIFFDEGDFGNQIYDYLIAWDYPITQLGAAWIAARLTGEETRTHTIYEHMRVSNRIPLKEHRELYSQLPFKHLRYATQFEDFERILNVDLQQTDNNGGRPPSVASLNDAYEKSVEQNELFTVAHFNQTPPVNSIIRAALQILRSLQGLFVMLSKVLNEKDFAKLEEINESTQELVDTLDKMREE